MIQLWEWKQWKASFTTVNVLSHIYLYFRIKSAISKGEDEIQGCKCNCLLKLLRILFLYWMTFFQSVWNLKKVVNRVVTKQSNLVRVAETCVSVPFYSLLYLLQNLEIDTDDMGGDWFWGLNRLLKCHPLAHKMWDNEKSLTEVFVSCFKL